MIDHTDYRLAFILPQSHQLLALQTGCGCELPVISVPLFQRPAEQLTRLIEEKWNIKTIILDVLWDDSLPIPCAVIEVRSHSWQYDHEGFIPVSLDSISHNSLGESIRTHLSSILAGGVGRGPFSRTGWIEVAQAWIQASVNDHEVQFTDDIRHLNGGGEFCLLRFGTSSGPALWLKAVGEPNAHEFGITTFLAKNYPQYLPRVVAARKDWNAWVMEELGSSLHSSDSLEDFECVVRRLAKLQREVVGRSEELLSVQCGDHRVETLCEHIDELTDYLVETMALQTSTKVPKLSPARVKELGGVLHQACSALQELGIPDSLMHSDISPGSILSDGSNYVFTDWCEANVGNPFVTFEQLCVHISRKADQADLWVKRLKSVYKSCWIELLTENQIKKAFQLTPLISVLSYLYGRGDWLQSPRRNHENLRSYSRSLARHMDRIAMNPDLMEALCQPK